MGIQLKPVKQKLISDQVFDQLRELIYRGMIKPGEKLLPERDLALQMNVSRSTVRTAMKRLLSMGLVTQKQGKGTFARDFNDESNAPLAEALNFQTISLEKLLEIRLPLECNAAALAAQRADGEDIKAISHSFLEMGVENKMGRLGSQADASFHMAIAYAAKNPLHIMIIRSFYDHIFHGIKETLASLYQDTKNIHIIMKQHEEILHAIQRRASEKASASMEKHIRFLMDFVGTRNDAR